MTAQLTFVKLLVPFLAVALGCADSPEFELRSGIVASCWDRDHFDYFLESETAEIPIDLGAWRNPGVLVRSSEYAPFVVQAIYYLPDVPDELGQFWRDRGYGPEDAVSGLREDPIEAVGLRIISLGLQPSDPLGVYRVDIHIQGAKPQSAFFNVHDGRLPNALPDDSGPPACPEPPPCR